MTRNGFIALLSLIFVLSFAHAKQDTGDESFSEAGADTCLGCHNSPDMLVIFKTPHGQQVDPKAPLAQLQCEACHGAAGPHTDRRTAGSQHQPVITFGIDASTPAAEQDGICSNCHSAVAGPDWHGSVHERTDVTCSGCHQSHAARDAVLARTTQNTVCFDCHQEQRADSMKPSSHPLRSDGLARVAAMACTDCHTPHSGGDAFQLSRETVNQVCFECHAQYRGPMLFEHAPVSEDCSLCHEAHGSIHAPLLTQRQPLLCQACHSQAGHPSVSFTDGSLPQNTPSSMVLQRSCANCHTQVHGSNHPSGFKLMR